MAWYPCDECGAGHDVPSCPFGRALEAGRTPAAIDPQADDHGKPTTRVAESSSSFSSVTSGEAGLRAKLEPQDVTGRSVQIIHDLYDLKEDVLFGGGFQPQYDSGLLDAVLTILRANVDDEDPRFVAEQARQLNDRLGRACESVAAKKDAALGLLLTPQVQDTKDVLPRMGTMGEGHASRTAAGD